MDYLFVGIGGVFGALSRYYLGKYIASRSNRNFPLGTFIINITGAFILSFLTFFNSIKITVFYPEIRFIVMIGFLGAYTTFSTLSYETYQLIQSRDYYNLFTYVLGTLLIGLAAVYLGMLVGKML